MTPRISAAILVRVIRPEQAVRFVGKPATQSTSARARSPAPRRRPGTPGLVAGLTVAATAAVVVAALVLLVRSPGPTMEPDAPSLPISIGGIVFNVPPAAIRVALQRRTGAQGRVDLAFLRPALTPPDRSAQAPVSEELPAFDRVFVTIAALDDTLDPAERIKSIYPRYFDFGRFAGPDGLLVIRFRDDTPYQGEDLFYDPNQPEGFVVRCSRPGAGPTPGICLWERRLRNAADITVRFPRDWLASWRAVADGLERLVASLQSRASGRPTQPATVQDA